MHLTATDLRSLAARAAFGTFRSTPDGRLLEADPAFAAMLGHADPAPLVGIDLLRNVLLGDDDRARWHTAVAAGTPGAWHEVRCRRRDGAPVLLGVAVGAERDDAGEVTAVYGIADDATRRLRREEIVRTGERMSTIGRTLTGVAHEINNPLAAITGYAQILLKQEQAPDDRHALETILNEARRAARVVRNLLTIALREEVVEREQVDLDAIAAFIVESQRYALETRGIRVVVDRAAQPAWIIADRARIEQVVLTLIVDAGQRLESMLAKGEPLGAGWAPLLRVATSVSPDGARLEVSDNGRAIPPDDLARLRDPYRSASDEGDGAGAVPAVVHDIVLSHGGEIGVASAPGTETRFTISLPSQSPPPPAASRAARDAARTTRTPLDILVIDDEPAIRQLLSRLLSARGHAVLSAADGAHALRLAEQASFDVVLSDLRMPGMDGREVIRRLRLLPSFAGTRFILSTGDAAASGAMAHAGAGGEVTVVDKPYNVELLMQLIEAT